MGTSFQIHSNRTIDANGNEINQLSIENLSPTDPLDISLRIDHHATLSRRIANLPHPGARPGGAKNRHSSIYRTG